MSVEVAVAPRRSTLVWTLCVAYAGAGVTMVTWHGTDVVRGLGVCAVFLGGVAAVEAAVVSRGRGRRGPRRLTGAATLVGLCVTAIVVGGVLAAVVLAPDLGERLGWALGWLVAALPLVVVTQLTRSAYRNRRDR